jgi:hypothetical protein
MISDPADPVVAATLALDDAQRAYDWALTQGRPLPAETRRELSVRLAACRRALREAIYGFEDAAGEASRLTQLLPALSPCELPDEE